MIRLLPVFALMALLSGCNSQTTDPKAGDSMAAANGAANGELANIGLRNLTTPTEGVLCSGQPSEAQFDALQAAGVGRIVHLRLAKEKGTGWEEERAKQAGVAFVRLPIAGKAGLTRDNVQRFAELMDGAPAGHTLVSCGSSNRVGAMLALKARWHDGKSAAEAMALGKKAGLKSLTATVAKLVEEQ